MNKRLTEKYYAIKTQRCNGKTQQVQMFINVYNKLAQLEDIEEELGIDLITLFKAHTQGIYYKGCSYKINSVDVIFMDRCIPRYSCECVVDGMGKTLELKDYGVVWALTKEELE